jgi:bacterioferritin (cytochrome b1)
MATNNVEYDILTALQSKLEAVTAYDKYIQDCEQSGDTKCRELFEQIKRDDAEHAQKLREQLKNVLG